MILVLLAVLHLIAVHVTRHRRVQHREADNAALFAVLHLINSSCDEAKESATQGSR